MTAAAEDASRARRSRPSRVTHVLAWIVVLAAMASMALARAWLSYKWGVFQAWWGAADDGLLVREAIGADPADQLTLAKRPGYSFLLRVVHLSRVPLTVAIALAWTMAALCAAWIAWRIARSAIATLVAYTLAIWCPMGFDGEVGQRAYRGGMMTPAILILACALVAAFIAASWWERLPWTLITGMATGFLWLAKEDSLWILPMVAVATVAAMVKALTADGRRILGVIVLLPALLIPLGLDHMTRERNMRIHGVDLLDTRTEGELAGWASRIYRIREKDHTYRRWSPDTAINTAIDIDPDLEPLRPYLLEGGYRVGQGDDKGIYGDYLTWQIRYAITMASNGAWPSEPELQRRFAKANRLLDQAAERGRITYDDRFSPGALTSPLDGRTVIDRVLPNIWPSLKATVTMDEWRPARLEDRQPNDPREQALHDTYLAYINETERPREQVRAARTITEIWTTIMPWCVLWALAGMIMGMIRRRAPAYILPLFVAYAAVYTFCGSWFLVFKDPGDGMWTYVTANTTPLVLTATVMGIALAMPGRRKGVARHGGNIDEENATQAGDPTHTRP